MIFDRMYVLLCSQIREAMQITDDSKQKNVTEMITDVEIASGGSLCCLFSIITLTSEIIFPTFEQLN